MDRARLGIGLLAISLVACGDDAETNTGGGGSGASGGGIVGPSGPSGSGGSIATGGAGTGGAGRGRTPKAEFVPQPFGTCPDWIGPEVVLPTSRGPRPVKLWISDAATTLDGPLVFYWHGWHGTPGFSGMDQASLDRLLAMGGMFVAPYTDPDDIDEYWGVYDLVTADQVVACAIDKVGIDLRRIYSIGYSAGGMQTYRFSLERSGYVAASIMYSPGSDGMSLGARQDPENLFPTLFTWGATEDPIFKQLTESYFDNLTGFGQFSVMFPHAQGHVQPGDVTPIALDFLLAHPFGTQPSPYTNGLPATFPSYCKLTK